MKRKGREREEVLADSVFASGASLFITPGNPLCFCRREGEGKSRLGRGGRCRGKARKRTGKKDEQREKNAVPLGRSLRGSEHAEHERLKSEPAWKIGRKKGVVIPGVSRRSTGRSVGRLLARLHAGPCSGVVSPQPWLITARVGLVSFIGAGLDGTYRHFERTDSESMPDVDVLLLDIDRGPSSGLSRADCVPSLSSIARISCQSVRGLASRGRFAYRNNRCLAAASSTASQFHLVYAPNTLAKPEQNLSLPELLTAQFSSRARSFLTGRKAS